MKAKELIEKLKELPEDYDVLMGINKSSGFPTDTIDCYPIEDVTLVENIYSHELRENSHHIRMDTPYTGWIPEDNKTNNRIVLYVFP